MRFRVRDLERWLQFLLVLGAMLWGISLMGQTVQVTPLSPALPKACWPPSMLTGKDTAWLYVPCRSLEVLAPGFRTPLECMMDRQRKGGWSPLVQETQRSDALQQRYYAKGRTAPGPRVTNAKDVRTTVHGYGMAADVISAKKGWKDPKYFQWQMIHAEACGLVAGAAWKRFPDAPHVQAAAWGGAPPEWARALQADSLAAIWRRAGVGR